MSVVGVCLSECGVCVYMACLAIPNVLFKFYIN